MSNIKLSGMDLPAEMKDFAIEVQHLGIELADKQLAYGPHLFADVMILGLCERLRQLEQKVNYFERTLATLGK